MIFVISQSHCWAIIYCIRKGIDKTARIIHSSQVADEVRQGDELHVIGEPHTRYADRIVELAMEKDFDLRYEEL